MTRSVGVRRGELLDAEHALTALCGMKGGSTAHPTEADDNGVVQNRTSFADITQQAMMMGAWWHGN